MAWYWSTNFGFQVRCIDISPGGGLGVSSGDDSTLLVWETSTGVVRVWFYLQKVLQACNSTLQHRKLQKQIYRNLILIMVFIVQPLQKTHYFLSGLTLNLCLNRSHIKMMVLVLFAAWSSRSHFRHKYL